MPGVTVDLTMSTVLHSDNRFAYIRAEICRKTDNLLIAYGQHTKALITKRHSICHCCHSKNRCTEPECRGPRCPRRLNIT
ncbi:unnamed protein product [Gongylonema pulchrum]|uniref:Transposase n=1 Tax=Gongylonema pulchrum TaxID=637853 RepID=A0A183DDW0_9BILA|nr:unnamed protein product [Gongylonema pulchrum]